MSIIKGNFVSEWDGCEDIVTTCRINTETGEIFDIESLEVEKDYEDLISEYVELPGGQTFDVESNEDNEYFLTKEQIQELI